MVSRVVTPLIGSIWDWKYRAKMNKFSNTNVAGSSISSVHFINEMASSLMLTASSELTSFVQAQAHKQPMERSESGEITINQDKPSSHPPSEQSPRHCQLAIRLEC